MGLLVIPNPASGLNQSFGIHASWNIEIRDDAIDNALSKVNTEFSVLADDDDFFNKDSLIKSKNFLKNNNEFSTCRGTIGNFKINSNFSLQSINLPQSQQSIIDEKSKERVANNFILNSSPTFYDVHRSELQKKQYDKKIIAFLKKEKTKLPASDIDFQLKIGNIDLVKALCEELYRDKKIGRTGNYRYFV